MRQRGAGAFRRLSGLNGQMELPVVLVFVFFSFSIFASLEPISDSAHVLSVIDDAMDQLDKLRENHFIDSDGKDIPLRTSTSPLTMWTSATTAVRCCTT